MTGDAGADPDDAGADPGAVLAALEAQLRASRRYDIGFPGARDLTFPPLALLLTSHMLNNIGDPYEPGHGRSHTKVLEQQVVSVVADFLQAPGTRWGYVTTGSTEATVHALHMGARRFPHAVCYTSSAAHYSVAKAARLLRLPFVTVAADGRGELDLADLRRCLEPRRHRPALIVATAGTTMSEGVDDVAGIAAICDRLGVVDRRIHVDAALSGIPLALLPDADRPRFAFDAGATSMAVSGHKFLGTLMPCAVLVHARAPHGSGENGVAYTGSADTTIVGSRSGHTPLLLWWVLTTLGRSGLARRAEGARTLAVHTHEQLLELGFDARRNRHAFTVTFPHPPRALTDKWALASDGRTAHVVCMPGIERDQLDEFLADAAAVRPRFRRLAPAGARLGSRQGLGPAERLTG